jgi:hypothetical protein
MISSTSKNSNNYTKASGFHDWREILFIKWYCKTRCIFAEGTPHEGRLFRACH